MVFTAGHVPDVLVKYEEWLSQHDCLTKRRVCYSQNEYSEASHRLQECPDLNKHVKRNVMMIMICDLKYFVFSVGTQA